jgi:uncharacterized membrane protein
MVALLFLKRRYWHLVILKATNEGKVLSTLVDVALDVEKRRRKKQFIWFINSIYNIT